MQITIAQDIQNDAPDWLLDPAIAATAACWHTGTKTGTIGVGLMCHLLKSPA